MADSEKLTALKKAYADTILNTAKEAAARVMVSEKKARGYQQELLSVKEEALRMLLRLKQMYDSKVKEAETTALIQQGKIEELEAQLGEAEDIVKDLRMELRELRDELIHLTRKQAQARCNNQSIDPETPKAVISLLEWRPEPVMTSETKDSVSNRLYDPNRCADTENCYACHSGFPSIMMRRKGGLELNRNGCTQRILALDRDIPNGGSCHSKILDELKTELLAREEGNLNDNAAVQEGGKEAEVSAVESALPTRKSASRLKKFIPQVSRNSMSQSAEELQRPDFSDGRSSPSHVDDNNGALEDPQITETLLVSKSLSDAAAKSCEEPSKLDVQASDTSPQAVKVSDCLEAMPLQPVTNKIIRYTFERKRKKESLSSPDRGSSLESTPSKRTKGEENGSLDCTKPGMVMESPCNSQRLAQVARQKGFPEER